MLSTRTQNEFGTWGIPGRKPVVVYALSVMSRLAAEATQAKSKAIGGVLFGTINEQDTRIQAYRGVECRDADEHGTPFTEAGESALAESWAHDPELAGMRPVGWYRSRWESPIQLGPEDLRIWNAVFPDPAQIALVLRVQENSPVRAGFFFRPQQGGPVRVDSSYRTFEIDAIREATADVGRLAQAVKSGGTEIVAAPPVESTPIPPPPELFTLPEPRTDRAVYLWAAATAASLAVISFVLLSWWQSGSTAAGPAREIGLRFRGPANHLQLIWDPQSSLIRSALRAELRLVDAEQDSTEVIAGAELGDGARPVANRSGLVEAQMRIYPRTPNSSPAVVAAQFVGPAASEVRRVEAPAVHAAIEPPAPSRAERARLQYSLDARLRSNDAVEGRIRRLKELLAARKQLANRALVTPVTTPAAPPPPQPQPAKPGPLAQVTQQPSAPAPAVPVEQAPAFGSDRAPARATVPAPEPPVASTYAGPASGKFIWTGYLAPGRTVTIDGRRASSGSVNGSLPGVPVRISVYPGEFSTSGLSVFSASPRHQAGTMNEGRSSQNGWNNTRYVYDPARARDAQVSSAPNESGGFKQMQIVGGERPVSVVVVEWSVAR